MGPGESPAGRRPAPRDRGVHLREPRHAGKGRLDLRAHRGQGEAALRPGNLARDLDPGHEHARGPLAGLRRDRHHGARRLRPGSRPRERAHPEVQPHPEDEQRRQDLGSEATEKFHIYAVEWDRERIDFFVDGKKYFTFRNEGSGADTWPFDKEQYLLLNLAIGGGWGGQKGIDDKIFPQRFLIDYVRVYQKPEAK